MKIPLISLNYKRILYHPIFSSDEEEEEEDEDEARMQEEMKDFIVDQPEEDEKSEGEEDKESEKSDDEFGELSEEDLDVINENLGTKVHGGRVQLSEDEDEDVRQRIEKDLFDRGGGICI